MKSPTLHSTVFLAPSLKNDPKVDTFLQSLKEMGSDVVWLAGQAENGVSRVFCNLMDAGVKNYQDALVIADNAEDFMAATAIKGLTAVAAVADKNFGGLNDFMAQGQQACFGVEALMRHLTLGQ